MITFLSGKLVEALPTRVVVDVGGVGYEVLIPVSSFEKLPAPGQPVEILTQLIIREDAHVLYGFSTEEERQIFKLLIGAVTGIGPKLALNILSGMRPGMFRSAVAAGDVKGLAQISGVGKKTAERIVVELRDRLGDPARREGGQVMPSMISEGERIIEDAVAGLVTLGHKPAEARELVRQARSVLGGEAPADELVRACLKRGK